MSAKKEGWRAGLWRLCSRRDAFWRAVCSKVSAGKADIAEGAADRAVARVARWWAEAGPSEQGGRPVEKGGGLLWKEIGGLP